MAAHRTQRIEAETFRSCPFHTCAFHSRRLSCYRRPSTRCGCRLLLSHERAKPFDDHWPPRSLELRLKPAKNTAAEEGDH